MPRSGSVGTFNWDAGLRNTYNGVDAWRGTHTECYVSESELRRDGEEVPSILFDGVTGQGYHS